MTKYSKSVRRLRYILLLLWIGGLLFASTGNGSMSNTSLFIRPLLKFLLPLASEDTLIIYHGYIRKFAHFGGYAVLSLLAFRAFNASQSKRLYANRYLPAFVLTALVATVDEINQSFNPARTGSIYDVLLDCAGGLTMLFFVLLVSRTNSKRKKSSLISIP